MYIYPQKGHSGMVMAALVREMEKIKTFQVFTSKRIGKL